MPKLEHIRLNQPEYNSDCGIASSFFTGETHKNRRRGGTGPNRFDMLKNGRRGSESDALS